MPREESDLAELAKIVLEVLIIPAKSLGQEGSKLRLRTLYRT